MTLPNYITLLRILLVPFFFTALVSYEPPKEYYRWIAFGIFIVAALSDALDGILARVLKQRSELGKILDPVADKLLLVTGYVGLLFISTLPICPPLWIVVTIVFRDIVLVIGIAVLFLVTGRFQVVTNTIGKMTTAAQMVTLAVILAQWNIAVIFWNITAALTILSCLVYVTRDLKLLNGKTGS